MDHKKENVHEALGITDEEFDKVQKILTGEAGPKNFEETIKALDALDFKNKDTVLNLAMIRIAQSAYGSAEKNISERIHEDSPFFQSLYSFLHTLSELTERNEYKEASKTAVVLIACMILNTAGIPVSLLVSILLESLDHLSISTKEKLRGALALADVIDPHNWIIDPKDVGIH